MKIRKALSAVALATAALASAPASAAADYSLLFQGVTFEIDLIDADTFTLTMLNTNAATGVGAGGWAGITSLNAFQIKDVGSFASATATGPGGFFNVDKELTANGCAAGGGSDLQLCFSGFTPVASSLSWTIDVTGGSLDVGSKGPHLKVRFGKDSDSKYGDLLSQDIPPVPEPETYAMLLAGLGLLGAIARRRKAGQQ